MSCDQCHSEEDDPGYTGFAFLNGETAQYEQMTSADELCIQCHNKEYLMNSKVSANHAHQEYTCVDCHDVHKVEVGCGQSGCHSEIQSNLDANIDLPVGHTGEGEGNYMCGGSGCHQRATRVAEQPIHHQPVHKAVACATCHDAGGLDVLVNTDGRWVTALPEQLDDIVVSHTIGQSIPCETCH